MGNVTSRLKSRKFWFALLGALLPVLAQAFTGEIGWDKAVVSSLGLIASYIFGQAYQDGKKAEAEGQRAGARERALSEERREKARLKMGSPNMPGPKERAALKDLAKEDSEGSEGGADQA